MSDLIIDGTVSIGVPVECVAFSPDGMMCGAVGHGTTAMVVASGERRLQFSVARQRQSGHQALGSVRAIAFAPDGMRLCVGGGARGPTIRDAKSGQFVTEFDVGTSDLRSLRIFSVTFAPDGSMVATGSFDRRVRIWEAQNGALKHVMEGHTSSVLSVDFACAGSLLVSGGPDGQVCLWDPQTGVCDGTLKVGDSGGVGSLRVSHDGEKVAVGTKNATTVWSLADKTMIARTQHPDRWVSAVAWSPDDCQVVTVIESSEFDEVRLWDWAAQGTPETVVAGILAKGIDWAGSSVAVGTNKGVMFLK